MADKTGLILLAAGNSSRLGRPKQLLTYQGESLLQRAFKAALASSCGPVVLVLGSNSDQILKELSVETIHPVINDNWEEGLAASIRSGLNELLVIEPKVTSAILMLCDQPFTNAKILNTLLETQKQSGKGIIACAYQDTWGTPALFSKTYFKELQNLLGKEGAKHLLYKYPHDLVTVPFPLGAVDIDTAADYQLLIKHH